MAQVIRLAAAALAIGGLAGAATPAERRDPLDRELAGRVAGKPVDCIDNSRTMGPQIIDDRTILYRESGARTWRNELPERCPGLRPSATLVVELYGSQLCRNDRVRAVEPGSIIPGPTCRLGNFTPYDKPRR